MRRSMNERLQDLTTAVVLIVATVVTAALCVVAYQHAHPSPDVVVDQPFVPKATPSAEPSADVPTLAAAGPYSTLWLGDALTAGAGASSPAQGYRRLVVAALAARGTTDVVTTQAPLDQAADLDEAATGDGAPFDLVVVELGTTAVGGGDLGPFKRRYRNLVREVRKASPSAALVCLGVWAAGPDARPYDGRIASLCAQSGGTFVALAGVHDGVGTRGPAGRPVFAGVGAKPRTTTGDAETPNDVGYAQISARVLSALNVDAP